jgi:N-acetylglucosamine-6-phosphate deacetylase
VTGRRLGVARALVDGELVDGDVEVGDDGRIAAVGLRGTSGSGTAVPGFVDLQVNGVGGVDLRAADPDGYAVAARVLAAHGAVAVQPTFFSLGLDGYRSALGVLAEVRAADPSPAGCRFLPAHLEGPFLSPGRVGAHLAATFLPPDPDVLDGLLDAGPVGMVTLAPELPGALDAVGRAVAAGVVVSVGHTEATAAQVRAAADAGARHLTHCWNAHRRFAPRDPGPAGAALADPRLTVGLIADLVHVAPETVALTAAAARGRLAATTDAIAPAGTGADLWQDGRAAVHVDGGAARLADGTLAGGVATPDVLLRNLLRCGLDVAEAVDACGGAQRRLLGREPVHLRPGDPADVAVLDDSWRPVRTLVGGGEAWAVAEGAPPGAP